MGDRRFSTEEIVRRGQTIYDEQIRPKVEAEPGNVGKYIAVDIETGDYEIDDDYGARATGRLREKHPDGAFFVQRIGHLATVKIGYRGLHLMRR